MKEKAIIFIVGLLLGAIISTGSIYIYTVANSSGNNPGQKMQINTGTPPGESREHSGIAKTSNNENTQNNNQNNN